MSSQCELLLNNQNIKIIPLDEPHLVEAVALLNSIFVEQDEEENVETCFKASLAPETYRQTLQAWKIIKLNYFLVVLDDQVIGNSGMYEMLDNPDTAWLGWTCVAPEYENLGLGKKLITYVIAKAQQQGYHKLKLHTVDIDYQRKAHRLYEKLGFACVQREPGREIRHDRLYYEVNI